MTSITSPPDQVRGRVSAELALHLFALLRRRYPSASLRSVLSRNVQHPSHERNIPMPMRSFSLNEPEAYAALRSSPDPWAWGPQLSRNSLWGERSDPVAVMAESEVEAGEAFKQWQRHMDAGHFNSGR